VSEPAGSAAPIGAPFQLDSSGSFHNCSAAAVGADDLDVQPQSKIQERNRIIVESFTGRRLCDHACTPSRKVGTGGRDISGVEAQMMQASALPHEIPQGRF